MSDEMTVDDIRRWQRKRLSILSASPPVKKNGMPITIVIWHYWQEALFDTEFDFIEMSIRETWRQLGLMKTILVVNRVTRRVEQFCEQFSAWVRIDLCKELKPGSLLSMSYDAIKNVHRRVDTDYVMNVHPDGWPLRSGVEEFIGQYDYIGAPWAQCQMPNKITKTLLLGGRHVGGVGNGGFSLRSRKLFEIGAWYYRKKYKIIPGCFLFYEDIYYTMFLPSYERMYREIIHIAPAHVAVAFSLSDNFDLYKKFGGTPLGFHSWRAFARLMQDGYLMIDSRQEDVQ